MSDYQIYPEVVTCERHGPYTGSMVCPSCMGELKANGVQL